MQVLRAFPHKTGTYSAAVLDTALLAALSTPAIYIWVIKPFIDERLARDRASLTARKLINLVNEPIDFHGGTLHVGANIGIRLLGFEELDTETVISEADIAMYRAKQAGRGRVVFFEK